MTLHASADHWLWWVARTRDRCAVIALCYGSAQIAAAENCCFSIRRVQALGPNAAAPAEDVPQADAWEW